MRRVASRMSSRGSASVRADIDDAVQDVLGDAGVADPRDAGRREHVNLFPQHLLQIRRQLHESEADGLGKLDDQVDIAVLSRLPLSERAEKADPADAELGCEIGGMAFPQRLDDLFFRHELSSPQEYTWSPLRLLPDGTIPAQLPPAAPPAAYMDLVISPARQAVTVNPQSPNIPSSTAKERRYVA